MDFKSKMTELAYECAKEVFLDVTLDSNVNEIEMDNVFGDDISRIVAILQSNFPIAFRVFNLINEEYENETSEFNKRYGKLNKIDFQQAVLLISIHYYYSKGFNNEFFVDFEKFEEIKAFEFIVNQIPNKQWKNVLEDVENRRLFFSDEFVLRNKSFFDRLFIIIELMKETNEIPKKSLFNLFKNPFLLDGVQLLIRKKFPKLIPFAHQPANKD